MRFEQFAIEKWRGCMSAAFLFISTHLWCETNTRSACAFDATCLLFISIWQWERDDFAQILACTLRCNLIAMFRHMRFYATISSSECLHPPNDVKVNRCAASRATCGTAVNEHRSEPLSILHHPLDYFSFRLIPVHCCEESSSTLHLTTYWF